MRGPLDRPLRVGILGMGFMGRVHAEAWAKAEADGCPVTLVAVADPSEDRRSGRATATGNLDQGSSSLDLTRTRGYESAEGLFADPEIDLVSLCTPTPTHIPLGLLALEAGKHLLCEKPIDFDPRRVRRLAEESEARKLEVFPAMCMRFWPGWDWLADAVREEIFGAVKSATFQRLGTRPDWSSGFYDDDAKSGGALGDLHVHDLDFIHHLFGIPDEIDAIGNLVHATLLYHYPQGPAHVACEAAWDQHPGTPFRMRYLVNFEKATADFDLGREQPLMVHRDGKSEAIALSSLSGYDGEVRHVAEVLTKGIPSQLTLCDAEAVAELMRRERDALLN